MKDRIKAFGYIRVGDNAQEDGDSQDRQERAIREYAETAGYEIAELYADKGLGSTIEGPPALVEMMVSLELNGHGIETVIVERIEALARELIVQEAIINDFRRHGTRLISIHDGEALLSDDPMRNLVRRVLEVMVNYDRTMTILRLRAARERKRNRLGKCEGRKGYKDDWARYTELVDLIERIKSERQSIFGRNHRKLKTYAHVAEELNRRGYKTFTGKPFTGQRVQDLLRKRRYPRPDGDEG